MRSLWSRVVAAVLVTAATACYQPDDFGGPPTIQPTLTLGVLEPGDSLGTHWVEFGVMYEASTLGATERARILRENGGWRIRNLRSVPGMLVRVAPDRADEYSQWLHSNSWVRTVEHLDGLDQTAADLQTWGSRQMQTPSVLGLGLDGNGIKVGVVDGAFDCSHSDLSGQFKGGTDVTGGGSYCATGDTAAHGTSVAGVIAAKADGSGIIGVAPGSHLYGIRVCERKLTRQGYSSKLDSHAA